LVLFNHTSEWFTYMQHSQIIKRQQSLFPGVQFVPEDIKHISRWTPPHFTEPCMDKQDLKLIGDGGFVYWSKDSPIPRRGVVMDLKEKELIKADAAVKYVTKLGTKLYDEKIRLTREETDALIDLLIDKDEGILTIFRNFHEQPYIFKYHAFRYLQRKTHKENVPPNIYPINK